MNDLIRIDKNISHHYGYFKKYSSDDSKLMYLILIYFAEEHQNNLFGFGTFDPVKFCKKFKLEPNNYIWKKHNNPKQLIGENKEELRKKGFEIYDTILENSLYCLLTDVFQFTGGTFYLQKEGVYQKNNMLESIQFITSLNKIEIKVAKTVKKEYQYQLSENFLKNLSFLFFNIKKTSLIQSFSKKNEGLYLFIKDLVNVLKGKKQQSICLKFDLLKDKLNIQSENSKYTKQKIKKAFSDLQELEDLKSIFEINWYKKKEHNYYYGVEFVLKNFDTQNINREVELLRRETNEHYLKTLLIKAFERRYPQFVWIDASEKKEKYKMWLQKEEIDTETKKAAFIDYLAGTVNEEFKKKMLFKAENFHITLKNEYEKFL